MFLPATVEALGFYVYRLDDPSTGRPFYIGKGVGNRAFQHIVDARSGATGDKCERIRSILATGAEPTIIVHRHGLDEATALHVEAALIDAFGLADLTNEVSGHYTSLGAVPASELNGRYGPPAEIDVPMMLIKIERQWAPNLTPDELYQRTRMYWVANPLARAVVPMHVAAVARGVIREVYRVEKWWRMSERPAVSEGHRAEGFDGRPAGGADRVGFDGAPDVAMAHLRGRTVPGIAATTQNPISYVNC